MNDRQYTLPINLQCDKYEAELSHSANTNIALLVNWSDALTQPFPLKSQLDMIECRVWPLHRHWGLRTLP